MVRQPVRAPLLLTLVVAWGLSSAGRGVVRACDLTVGRSLAAVVAAAVGRPGAIEVAKEQPRFMRAARGGERVRGVP